MKQAFGRFAALFLICVLLSACRGVRSPLSTEEEETTMNPNATIPATEQTVSRSEPLTPPPPDGSFDFLNLPRDTVKTLSERGETVQSFSALGTNAKNGGLGETGIVISPFHTLRVNGINVPVYSTIACDGQGRGLLHSFATVYVNSPSNFRLDVSLFFTEEVPAVEHVTVLPLSAGVQQSANVSLRETGTYTFLPNDPDQKYALSLTVRANPDEEAEIAQYRNRLGESRVTVLEAGVHRLDRISPVTNSVVYFRKNALILVEPKTGSGNNDPFILLNSRSNVRLCGAGILDFSLLDHQERIGLRLNSCSGVTVEGLTFVNNGAWNLYVYNVYNSYQCNIRNVVIFGHRTNSDGINICNSRYVTVSDCWVRVGDDCFSAKTLGGNATAENILFERCAAWTGKARAFGITGEANNITFRDCSVLWRDAVWDNNRLGGLAVIVEETTANPVKISNIRFENIEIYHDEGRPINITVYQPAIQGVLMSEIVFRDIRCAHAGALPQFRLNCPENTLSVLLDAVAVGGKRVLSVSDVQTDGYAEIAFS